MKRTLLFVLPLVLIAFVAVGCGGNASSESDYADRMAEEHADDTPEASGMVSGIDADLDTEMVTYGMVDGSAAMGYLAKPAGSTGLPGVIVIHEWWGLNDNIKAMTEQLAAEGYTALAVDIYGGDVAADPAAARELMSAAMENMEGARTHLTSAYAYLTNEAGAPSVASIGWCFGGAMSLNTALALPEELDAAIIYYGNVSSASREQLAELEMPIIGFFGAEDGGIPVESVRAFESTLNDLGKDVEIHIYDGAGHAFANPSGQNYQETAAQDSWMKATAFLEEHLMAETEAM